MHLSRMVTDTGGRTHRHRDCMARSDARAWELLSATGFVWERGDGTRNDALIRGTGPHMRDPEA